MNAVDRAAALEAYARHRADCGIFACRDCRRSGGLAVTVDDDIHYVGTVDSHRFTPQDCSCGLSALLREK